MLAVLAFFYRFRSMAPMYYRGASAAMLVYDVSVPETFGDIQSWVKELQRNTEEDTSGCCFTK